MEYETLEKNGIIHVTLRGRITYADHPSFRNVMSQLANSSATRLEFDLANAEFIDSAGLGMLLLVRDAAAQRKATVVLKGPKGQVQRIFASNRFESLFAIQQ